MGEKIRYIDLFAGTGGFSEAIGGNFECVFANDMMESSKEIYKLNKPSIFLTSLITSSNLGKVFLFFVLFWFFDQKTAKIWCFLPLFGPKMSCVTPFLTQNLPKTSKYGHFWPFFHFYSSHYFLTADKVFPKRNYWTFILLAGHHWMYLGNVMWIVWVF